MGYSSWSDEAYRGMTAMRDGKSRSEIFSGATKIHATMDPAKMKVRESRDSDEHQNSNAIIVAFDVTGSMGDIPERFARKKLGGLMRMLVDRGYVADPQILFAAVGDAESDRAPLQVGQFESGLEMDMWLTRMWLESGGGDAPESYLLAPYFAAHHTSVDCWEQRERKGYLFTIGDDRPKPLSTAQIKRVFGYSTEHPITSKEVVAAAGEHWHYFHIHVSRGGHVADETARDWRQLLGDRFLVLDHADAICELIGVAIGMLEGTVNDKRALADLDDAGVTKTAAKQIFATVQAAASARHGGAGKGSGKGR